MTTQTTFVPLLTTNRFSNDLEDTYVDTFRQVLKSGSYCLGPFVTEFETACRGYLAAEHALGVSSGTDALLLAMMALDIGPGDEVICPTYTFFASAGTISRLGAKPVFVDSLAHTYNMDPAKIEGAITPITKAIMPVHLYGQAADMTAIMKIAQQHDIPVVEDAAQAIGAKAVMDGVEVPVGSMGSFGCFSFYPTKNLGGFGDGGLVVTQNSTLAEKAQKLRVHGGHPKYYHAMVGGNFRMDAIQGALLNIKLGHLDTTTARRQRNAAHYNEALIEAGVAEMMPTEVHSGAIAQSDKPLLLPTQVASNHTYNQYTLFCQSTELRDFLVTYLREHSVGTEIYYPVPLHLQDCFKSLGHHAGDFPVAEAAALRTMVLPIFSEMTSDERDLVVKTVLAGLQSF